MFTDCHSHLKYQLSKYKDFVYQQRQTETQPSCISPHGDGNLLMYTGARTGEEDAIEKGDVGVKARSFQNWRSGQGSGFG